MSAVVAAKPVNRQEALSIAKAFMFERGMSMPSAGRGAFRAPRKSSGAEGLEETGGGILTDARADSLSDAYYYIFNAGNDQGYVIVSGDDRTEQILGYTDHGTFDAQNIPENMRSWLQLYADQIKFLDDNGIQVDGEAARAKARARRIVRTRHFVAPLVSSRWNQGEPYNLTCPDYYNEDGTKGRPAAGCVATAIAQVMNYYKFPDMTKTTIPSLTNTYKVRNAQGVTTNKTVTARMVPRNTPIDWEHMRDRYSGGETEEERLAVANLMLYCGMMVQMGYGASSGAVTSRAREGLPKYFGYDDGAYDANRGDYKLDEWIDLLYSEISTGHPVIFSGSSSGGSHAFVVDGFDGDNLFHVNWGWGGSSDGWFLITIMNPGDNTGMGASSSSDGYSMGQYFLAGLRYPDNEKALPHSCMTINDVKVSGVQISASFINWTGVSNNFYGCIMVLDDESGELRMLPGTQQSFGTMGINVYKTASFSVSRKLKEGTYRLTPASRYASNGKWYPRFNMKDEYIRAEVSETGVPRLTMVSPSEELRVDTIVYAGNCVVGTEQEVKVTFTNLGDEYYRELFLLTGKTAKKEYSKSRGPVMLRPGETASVSFFFTPEQTGTYNIWICREQEGTNVVVHDRVEITTAAQAKKAQLRLAAINIQNGVGGVVYGNRLKGYASIRNMKNTPFDGKVRLQIWEQGEGGSGTYWTSTSFTTAVAIGAGKIVSVPFDFENLKYDRHYYIVAYYVGQDGNLDNGGLWINEHQYKPNPGVLYWKPNGALVAVGNKGVFTTPAGACGVLMDKTSVRTMRVGANPNTIYVFTDGTSVPTLVGGRANIVQGARADSVVLQSGHHFFVPSAFTASTAILSHTFPDDADGSGWQALTLPFNVQKLRIDGTEYPLNDEAGHFWLYEFYALGDDGRPQFEPATELRANTPYLIAADATMAGRTLEFVGTDVTFDKTDATKCLVSSPQYSLNGSVLQTTRQQVYVLNDEGTAYQWTDEACQLPALGTWFTTTLADAARLGEIQLPPVPQSTDALTLTAQDAAAAAAQPVFDLSGRRVATLPAGASVASLPLRPGVYIVAGRKVKIGR